MSSSASSVVVPVAAPDIEQQRAAGVRRVGDVHAAAGHLEDQPRIDRAERELAARGARTRIGRVIEQPLELRAGEVGVDHEARLRGDERLVARRAQFIAKACRAPVLPHDRVGDRPARGTFPYERRLALVRDADGGDVARGNARLRQRLVHDARLRRPDFGRVVLDPAGLRKDLPKLLLRRAANGTRFVEDDGARTRGALIQRENARHARAPSDKQCCDGKVASRKINRLRRILAATAPLSILRKPQHLRCP